MKTFNGILTEKGNIKTEVAKGFKAQVAEKLAKLGYEVKENGRYALVLGEADGHVITANIDLAIGCDTDFTKKVRAPKAKADSEPVEIPNLF